MANIVIDFINKESPSISQVDKNTLFGIAMNVFFKRYDYAL